MPRTRAFDFDAGASPDRAGADRRGLRRDRRPRRAEPGPGPARRPGRCRRGRGGRRRADALHPRAADRPRGSSGQAACLAPRRAPGPPHRRDPHHPPAPLTLERAAASPLSSRSWKRCSGRPGDDAKQIMQTQHNNRISAYIPLSELRAILSTVVSSLAQGSRKGE